MPQSFIPEHFYGKGYNMPIRHHIFYTKHQTPNTKHQTLDEFDFFTNSSKSIFFLFILKFLEIGRFQQIVGDTIIVDNLSKTVNLSNIFRNIFVSPKRLILKK
jgi:hypothetical protein